MPRSRSASDNGPDLTNCGRFPTTETTLKGPRLRRGEEPALRRRIRLEELEEEACDLRRAGGGRVRAVLAEVVARPREAVGTRRQAVRPQIRPPTDPRALELALHPVLDEPARGVSAVIGGGLRVERRDGVAAVCPAGHVDQTEVWEARCQDPRDGAEIRSQG